MTLKKELLKRFEIDQKLSKERDWTKLKYIYQENTIWLKDVIGKGGWPSQDLVGIVGEQSAWLIAQHSSDTEFQEECLLLIKNLPKTKERREYIAYLTDKILVTKGEKQIFGTQFYYGEDGKLKPRPIKHLKNLEKRRKNIGLEPFGEYKKRMQAT